MELNLSSRTKGSILAFLTVVVILITLLFKPIPQLAGYHIFADTRYFWSVPNFWNVVTNIPFLVTGIAGLSMISKSGGNKNIKISYTFLFVGIFLTGFGSAYYHYSPNNNSLIFDRIPMTIVFMSLLSATITEAIDPRAGSFLLGPLLLTGIGSVLFWHFTEIKGHGDLRFYGVVQFYPMLLIPVILILYPSKNTNSGLHPFLLIVVWYVIAKVCELSDRQIYSATGFISGHSLKHLAAAIATWYLVKMFSVHKKVYSPV